MWYQFCEIKILRSKTQKLIYTYYSWLISLPETKTNPKYIHKINSYLAVNFLRLGYKIKSVDDRCLFWDTYKTRTLYGQNVEFFNVNR
jgi:hypothetical protein